MAGFCAVLVVNVSSVRKPGVFVLLAVGSTSSAAGCAAGTRPSCSLPFCLCFFYIFLDFHIHLGMSELGLFVSNALKTKNLLHVEKATVMHKIYTKG